jgi:hypothetical protein
MHLIHSEVILALVTRQLPHECPLLRRCDERRPVTASDELRPGNQLMRAFTYHVARFSGAYVLPMTARCARRQGG